MRFERQPDQPNTNGERTDARAGTHAYTDTNADPDADADARSATDARRCHDLGES